MNTGNQTQIVHWQKKMFWLMWITYAAFYLGRVNISVAMPGIAQEFGLSKTSLGVVLSALFAMYAIGQFINGQLGDKLNSRVIITIGLLSSAVLNIFFGLSGGIIGLMVVIWGLNGYFQSMGWGPTVKAMANWFPSKIRGKISGRLGTSYILGGALSWLLAGTIIKYFNWRATFWIPALIMAGIAIHWYLRARNAPEEIGLPSVEEQEQGIARTETQTDEHIGFRETLKITLNNPYIWFAAFGLFGLNIVRYGFMSWAPTYMFEEQGATISMAAYKAIAFPVAGGLGAIMAGWASDKLFQNRRAPVACFMLIALAVFCYLYRIVPGDNWVISLVILLLIGFFTFGPHILIVAALPADLGSRKAASSVTGFIDAMGYVGASITGVGTGYLIEHFSWDAAFYFWIAGALMAAVMMTFVWKFELTQDVTENKGS
ncbi:MAG: MFS transporter [Candidatus Marinimicrobia bacterium]|nr:MFS transporter [Candidatus Neomarinimicrobiota bacterium]